MSSKPNPLRVYVSSTLEDLRGEREAVIRWLTRQGHVAVESYDPDTGGIRDSCLSDVDSCDVYVGIIGHRYGWQPDETNPNRLSITQLEFRRAGEKGIPRIVLLSLSVGDVTRTDIGSPERYDRILDFRREVEIAVRPATFRNREELILGLSTGMGKIRTPPPNGSKLRDTAQASLEETVARLLARVLGTMAKEGHMRETVESHRHIEQGIEEGVSRMVAAAADPGASREAIAAKTALDAGDTGPAEDFLRRSEQQSADLIAAGSAEDSSQRNAAAKLARAQGAMAMGRDIRAAIVAYERAAWYEPDDHTAQIVLGDLRELFGDLDGALASFRTALDIAQRRAHAGATPGRAAWEREIALSYKRIGSVLQTYGDASGALDACRKAVGIMEKLALSDPANPDWQTDLASGYTRLGDVLNSQAERGCALAAFRRSVAIRRSMVKRQPRKARWWRDLSVSLNKVGLALATQGQKVAALAVYRESLAIRKDLVARDPANAIRQRELSVVHDYIGDVLAGHGDWVPALAAYRKALSIAESLNSRDAANPVWRRDLAVSCMKVGDVLRSLGDSKGALLVYQKSFEIRKQLATHDRANARHQVDLALACWKVAQILGPGSRDRLAWLIAGRDTLSELRAEGRLPPGDTWIARFEEEIQKS